MLIFDDIPQELELASSGAIAPLKSRAISTGKWIARNTEIVCGSIAAPMVIGFFWNMFDTAYKMSLIP